MSLSMSDKTEINESLNIPEILADFFLKKIDMPSYSDDSDHKHKSKRKKSKHKRRKHKKSKHRHESDSSDSLSDSPVLDSKALVDDISEKMGIQRLKKIKNMKLQSANKTVLQAVCSNDEHEIKSKSDMSNSFGKSLEFYGPHVNLMLSSTEPNSSKNGESSKDIDLKNNLNQTGNSSKTCDLNSSKQNDSVLSSDLLVPLPIINNEILQKDNVPFCDENKAVQVKENVDNESNILDKTCEIPKDSFSKKIELKQNSEDKEKLRSDLKQSSCVVKHKSIEKKHSRSHSRSKSLSRHRSPKSKHRTSRSSSQDSHYSNRKRRKRSYSHSQERLKSDEYKRRSRSGSKYNRRKKYSHSRSRSPCERYNHRRSRSRSRRDRRSRKRSNSRKRQRSYSKDRERSLSASRHKSRSRRRASHSRSRSKSKHRRTTHSKENSHSRSKSREKRRSRRRTSHSRSRSKSKHRRTSHSNEKSHSRSGSREKRRSRSKSKNRRISRSKEKSRSRSGSRENRRSRRRASRSKSRSRSKLRRKSHSKQKSRSRSGSRHRRSRRRASRSRSKSKSKHRRTSPSKEKSCSRSGSREKKSSSIKIDQAKILETAKKNVLKMMQNGTLPEGLPVENLKKDQLVSVQSSGKSVQELTDFCQRLSQKENEPDNNDDKEENPDDENGFIHHPFKVKEPGMIKLNIKNAVQLPIKTHAQKVAETARLSSQFPVSSGNQHKQKELEWIPVVPTSTKSETKPVKTLVSTTPVTAADSNKTVKALPETPVLSVSSPAPSIPMPISYPSSCSVASVVETSVVTSPLPPPPLPPVLELTAHQPLYHMPVQPVMPTYMMPNQEMVNASMLTAPAVDLPTTSVFKPPKKLDIPAIVAKRFQALTKLQQDPNDPDALKIIQDAQESIQEWVQSQQVPGLFTGSTDAKMLTAAELCGPKYHKIRKDIFSHAPPVTGGKGMSLLKKMGWNPGEGLGKNNEGSLEPLMLDIKLDKKGLVSEGENSKKGTNSFIKELQGKHPVSALMELCSKRRWKPPLYTCVMDQGPPHRKLFCFKVEVNGVEYQPLNPCSNKKIAKADAAVLCLQSLNILSKAV